MKKWLLFSFKQNKVNKKKRQLINQKKLDTCMHYASIQRIHNNKGRRLLGDATVDSSIAE